MQNYIEGIFISNKSRSLNVSIVYEKNSISNNLVYDKYAVSV